MRKLLMLAGAGAMLALGAPAAADAKPGKGKGASAQAHQRGHMNANRNGHADRRDHHRMDINRNGIDDRRERFIDRNRDGIDDRRQGHSMGNKYGGDICPPGLAKRDPPCVPPGQVGRSGFVVGERLPGGFGSIPFGRIPLSVRDQFDLDDDDRFVFRNGTLFVIDRDTRLIERIIESIVF